VGEENGAEFCAALEEDGMNYRAFSVRGRIRENLTLHEAGAPETRISFGGFAADSTLLAAVEEALADRLAAGDILTLTGSLPAGLPMAEVKAFLRRAKEKGARLVIDSRSFTPADLVEARPFLIKPNEEEAAAYLGRPVRDFADALAVARPLQEAGIANVIVSLGGAGALLASEDGIYTAVPPQVEVISTVGAGDSSIAGFLTEVDASAAEALRAAVAFGTAACMQAGTRPPSQADIAHVRAAVSVERI
jgi:1-phosphofructokinase